MASSSSIKQLGDYVFEEVSKKLKAQLSTFIAAWVTMGVAFLQMIAQFILQVVVPSPSNVLEDRKKSFLSQMTHFFRSFTFTFFNGTSFPSDPNVSTADVPTFKDEISSPLECSLFFLLVLLSLPALSCIFAYMCYSPWWTIPHSPREPRRERFLIYYNQSLVSQGAFSILLWLSFYQLKRNFERYKSTIFPMTSWTTIYYGIGYLLGLSALFVSGILISSLFVDSLLFNYSLNALGSPASWIFHWFFTFVWVSALVGIVTIVLFRIARNFYILSHYVQESESVLLAFKIYFRLRQKDVWTEENRQSLNNLISTIYTRNEKWQKVKQLVTKTLKEASTNNNYSEKLTELVFSEMGETPNVTTETEESETGGEGVAPPQSTNTTNDDIPLVMKCWRLFLQIQLLEKTAEEYGALIEERRHETKNVRSSLFETPPSKENVRNIFPGNTPTANQGHDEILNSAVKRCRTIAALSPTDTNAIINTLEQEKKIMDEACREVMSNLQENALWEAFDVAVQQEIKTGKYKEDENKIIIFRSDLVDLQLYLQNKTIGTTSSLHKRLTDTLFGNTVGFLVILVFLFALAFSGMMYGHWLQDRQMKVQTVIMGWTSFMFLLFLSFFQPFIVFFIQWNDAQEQKENVHSLVLNPTERPRQRGIGEGLGTSSPKGHSITLTTGEEGKNEGMAT